MESAKVKKASSGSFGRQFCGRFSQPAWRLLCLWLLSCGFTPILRAQSYEAGYNYYVKGDFPGAERAFGAALMRGPSQSDKARIYKMQGISQYMQGKRIEAEESFSQAKAISPNIRISPSEVLDETVIGFFNSITPPAKYFSDEPRAGAPEFEGSNLPEANAATYLLVNSNIPNAHVYVDGRFVGGVGQALALEPGVHEISVTASGYTKVTQTLTLQAQRTNRLQIDFNRKPPPKAPPPAVPAGGAVAKDKLTSTEPSPPKGDPAKLKRLRKDKAPPRRSEPTALTTARKQLKKKKRRAIDTSEPTSAPYPIAYALLPLGGYQYMNSRWLLGGAFSGLQLGGLAWYYINWHKANQEVESLNAWIAERDAGLATKITERDRLEYYNETTAEVKSRDAQVTAMRSNRDLGLIIFGTAWGLSIIEGIVNQTTDATPRLRQASGERRLPASQLTRTASRFPARTESAFSWHVQPAFYSSHPVTPSGFIMDFRLNF